MTTTTPSAPPDGPSDGPSGGPSGGPSAAPGLRAQIATYGTGFFSLSSTSLAAVAVPLWALHIGASPFWIGIAIGARAVLPLFLAIHGGVLMDRLGTRRTLLFLALLGVVLAPLHPILPWVGALIVLQIFSGLAYTTTWIGAQTQINQLTRGHPTFTGRFMFFTSAGTLCGPLLAGAAWDIFGAWGAFGLLCLWSVGMLGATWALPIPGPKPDTDPGREHPAETRLRPRDLLPNLGDYIAAFGLLASAAAALPILATFVRAANYGVRQSFYPVYLESIQFSGTEIGLLVAAASLISAPTSLITGAVARLISAHWLSILTLLVMSVMLGLTTLTQNLGLLLAMSLAFGLGTGLNLPVLISLLSRAVEPGIQGTAVGLRATLGQVASLTVPIMMGAVVEWAGMRAAFPVMGAVMLAGLGALLFVMVRARRAAAAKP